MNTIQLEYSLEWFKSRLPSTYPSYNGGDLLFFDENSINYRGNAYTSNYGMVPLDISPKLLGYDGFDDKFKISWCTFSKWFHMFKTYYWLLNNGGSCNRVYSSATDFYDSEFNASSIARLPFGSDRVSYEELDESFASMGGEVSAMTKFCDGKERIVGYSDNGFFKWSCENIVPSFEIPTEYIEYWDANRIYYPNVIEWISWFEERKGYSSNINKCAESSDCCDCEEYIHRGGENVLESLKTWFKTTNEKIEKINKIVKNNLLELEPHMLCEMNVLNSFGKPSLHSILSEKYDANVDLRHGSYSSTSNSSGGTIVDVDNKSMRFKEGARANGGATFNKQYMEMVCDDSAFEEYLPIYVNERKSEFCVSEKMTFYGINENNVKKYGSSKDEVIGKFSRKGFIDRNDGYGWFLVDGELYKVAPIESVTMDGEEIPVFRENGTNTPYVIVGGRDVYADYSFKENSYSFSFNKEAKLKRNPSKDSFDASNLRCISFNGAIKVFPSSSKVIRFTISDGTSVSYNLIDGYSVIDDVIYYIYNGNVTSGDTLDVVDGAIIDRESIIVRKEGIKVYECNVASGTTSSKLLELRSSNVMTDDNGNMIEALNTAPTKDTYNYQPTSNSELEPLYQVGNVSCIAPFRLSYDDYDKKSTPIRYVGNIISSMKFYFTDVNGEEIQDTIMSVGELVPSSLIAIQESTKKASTYKDNHPMEVVSDNIHCEIVYNVGATISYNNDDSVYRINGDSGVVYTEEVEFVREKVEYYMGNGTQSYPIYIYKLLQGDTVHFNATINVFKNTLKTTYSSVDGMDEYNGLDVYPTFQENYNIGVSSIPTVDSDINIDRGNNAAFEKHLKIGEVKSLEALENYTNGYFKMMEN